MNPSRVLAATWVGFSIVGFSDRGLSNDLDPWSVDPNQPAIEETQVPNRLSSESLENGADLFFLSYQVWTQLLSRIDGPRCAHLPSCSAFSHQAIRRYGFVLGGWMAINRLIRGARSSALHTLRQLALQGGVFFIDTLEENAFFNFGYMPMSGR